MPVPKKKTSKSRRDKRRTHYKLESKNYAICPHCQDMKLPHYTCPSCGMYKGIEVITFKEKKKT
ncbi:50S ribosomal protein L32 [bacterium]|nr:50S ribosomal protein L32 [bacterium]